MLQIIFFRLHITIQAMVSTGIKNSELSIKHLAKTFYFALSFFVHKVKSKRFGGLD